MGRVEWTRLSGEEIEAVVGMFICSDFPNAVRVRPSQGDGGVDIFVPGPEGFAKQRAVYQVKKFAENLTSSQKRKITRSFTTVVETSQEEGWEITDWHLVMPLDLTDHNLAHWFDELTKDVGFPCETHGLLYCDTKAAQYPKIVDYYLHDGKDRLQAAMGDLTAILARRSGRQQDDPLIATDVMPDLRSIYGALNEHDPFYRYEFSVSDSPPPAETSGEPGLVGVHATQYESVWIAIKIYALSTAALEEAPVGGRVQITVPDGDGELREQIQKFIDYGAPVTMPLGTVSGSLGLPGGLGGEFEGGGLQVLAAPEDPNSEPAKLSLAVLEPESDTVIASTTIRRTELSAGERGLRSLFADQAELFTLEMLTTAGRLDGTMVLGVEYDLAGRRPGELVDGLKVLAAWRAPNRLAFAPTFGPRDYGVVATIDTDRDGDSARWARVCESLATIQNHVSVLLRMPAEMSGKEAANIVRAAKLVSGETVTGPVSGEFSVNHPAEELSVDRQHGRVYEFIAIKDISIELGDETIKIGKQALFFRGTYTEITTDKSTIKPIGEGISARYTGDLEVTRVLARRVPRPAAVDGGESN